MYPFYVIIIPTFPEQIEALLTNNNVFVVATRPGGDGGHNLYLSVKFTNGMLQCQKQNLVKISSIKLI